MGFRVSSGWGAWAPRGVIRVLVGFVVLSGRGNCSMIVWLSLELFEVGLLGDFRGGRGWSLDKELHLSTRISKPTWFLLQIPTMMGT